MTCDSLCWQMLSISSSKGTTPLTPDSWCLLATGDQSPAAAAGQRELSSRLLSRDGSSATGSSFARAAQVAAAAQQPPAEPAPTPQQQPSGPTGSAGVPAADVAPAQGPTDGKAQHGRQSSFRRLLSSLKRHSHTGGPQQVQDGGAGTGASAAHRARFSADGSSHSLPQQPRGRAVHRRTSSLQRRVDRILDGLLRDAEQHPQEAPLQGAQGMGPHRRTSSLRRLEADAVLDGLLSDVEQVAQQAPLQAAQGRPAGSRAVSLQRRDADAVLEGLLQSVQEAEAAATAHLATIPEEPAPNPSGSSSTRALLPQQDTEAGRPAGNRAASRSVTLQQRDADAVLDGLLQALQEAEAAAAKHLALSRSASLRAAQPGSAAPRPAGRRSVSLQLREADEVLEGLLQNLQEAQAAAVAHIATSDESRIRKRESQAGG